ncbi:MAG: fibronectin type III domain-containing protein [Actinomycetia bacterium]|nr:fibronectin type III domain-containing protein [Actinomycetes bacterium]
MFNKILYFIKRNISRGNCTLKQEKGFSLVEVIVAILIISIITVVLLRSTIISVSTLKINKAKTLSSAVANEKIELIRTMDYEDIEITEENPNWESEYPELTEDGYDIDYEITWVYERGGSYKQVKISISKEPMNMPISVISQIYPLEGQGDSGGLKHPSPENLIIDYDSGSGSERQIKLMWEAPDTELGIDIEIDKYNIYRNDKFWVIAPTELFIYGPGDDNVYSYYVTAVYTDKVESNRSNKVTTKIPPPQDLCIIKYDPEVGAGRTVYLAWDPPYTTQLVLAGYVIYRDDIEIGVTLASETSYQDEIKMKNYTFYVTAVYEGDIESEPSEKVTTTTK